MSLENVRILKVFKSDKTKDGTLFKDKNGKPFYKIAIKTDKFGEDWYSCLAFGKDDPVMNLKEGDEKTLNVWQDGQWKNFKLPSKLDILEDRVTAIERKLNSLTSAGTKVPDFSEVDEVPPVNAFNDEEIPF